MTPYTNDVKHSCCTVPCLFTCCLTCKSMWSSYFPFAHSLPLLSTLHTYCTFMACDTIKIYWTLTKPCYLEHRRLYHLNHLNNCNKTTLINISFTFGVLKYMKSNFESYSILLKKNQTFKQSLKTIHAWIRVGQFSSFLFLLILFSPLYWDFSLLKWIMVLKHKKYSIKNIILVVSKYGRV